MLFDEPTGFVIGLVVMATAGALLPIRFEEREDHIILTVTSALAGAVLGTASLLVVWGGVALAAPLIVARAALVGDDDRAGVRAGFRSVAWATRSAFAITVGFLVSYATWAGALGRSYPMVLDSTQDFAGAALSGTLAWIGMMSVRFLSLRVLAGDLLPRGLDPVDSALVPYLLPFMVGTPLVAASVALYRPDDPWTSLVALAWCFPLWAASTFDLRRRRVAQDLRREALARQRLAAIGEVSARIVHQSRHQVGLMGWSIHRLRPLVGRTSPTDVALAHAEIDALAEAKDRLSEMLTAELLHEGARSSATEAAADDAEDRGRPVGTDGTPPGSVTDEPTYRTIVEEVTDQLAAEAAREDVDVHVELDPDAADVRPPAALHDVVFNLVDNAIDAAAGHVWVRAAIVPGAVELRVGDDGDGLAGTDAERAFEPFFTTKGDGTGMGLAIAEAVVGDVGGELRYERLEDRTWFVVVVAAGAAATPDDRATAGA